MKTCQDQNYVNAWGNRYRSYAATMDKDMNVSVEKGAVRNQSGAGFLEHFPVFADKRNRLDAGYGLRQIEMTTRGGQQSITLGRLILQEGGQTLPLQPASYPLGNVTK